MKSDESFLLMITLSVSSTSLSYRIPKIQELQSILLSIFVAMQGRIFVSLSRSFLRA